MANYSAPERIKNNAPVFRNVIDVTSSTRTLTVEESGSLVLLNLATGIDITLPAITSTNEVGTTFDFVSILAASSDTYTITALAADLLIGRAVLHDTDTSNTITSHAADVSDDLIFTLSDTADLPGTSARFTAISTTRWLVESVIFHTGNSATPFS